MTQRKRGDKPPHLPQSEGVGKERNWRGSITGVPTRHLQKYLDESAFRYNNRKHPKGVFNAWLSLVGNEKAQAR